MTHGSLFSGVGGFDIAAEWMGWKNLFNCEINPFCRKVLDYHFKESIGYEDITKAYFSEWRGKVDVLTGGFPCQPFSCAGRRKGADDDRYLWPQMLRVIREVRPTWVVGENVAGILSMVQPGEEVEVGNEASLFGETDRKRTLLRQEFVVETVCSDLEREGYTVQPLLIPACAVGAPHRRDRVWFVARRVTSDTPCNGDSGRSEEICGESRGQDGEMYAKSVKHGCLQAGFIADTILRRCERRGKKFDGRREEMCARQRVFSAIERLDESEFASDPAGKGFQEWEQSGGRQDKEEVGAREDDRLERPCGIGDSAHANSTGLEELNLTGRTEKERREDADRPVKQYPGNDREPLPADRWHDFPTQSPVCGRNDGLPFDVDSLTIPFTKWRQESVKAYGNAIVPPVAYEIFRAIEAVSNYENEPTIFNETI